MESKLLWSLRNVKNDKRKHFCKFVSFFSIKCEGVQQWRQEILLSRSDKLTSVYDVTHVHPLTSKQSPDYKISWMSSLTTFERKLSDWEVSLMECFCCRGAHIFCFSDNIAKDYTLWFLLTQVVIWVLSLDLLNWV